MRLLRGYCPQWLPVCCTEQVADVRPNPLMSSRASFRPAVVGTFDRTTRPNLRGELPKMAGTTPGHDVEAEGHKPIVIRRSSRSCVTSLLLLLALARKNEIRPRSQADLPCPVPQQKIFLFLFFGIHGCITPSRPIERGASRTSRNVGVGCDGRFSSQRASSARTNEGSRTAKSRGPDTPTLVSSSRRCLRVSRMTVARKPGAPGRSRISRKPIAQGRPDVRLILW